MPLTTKLKNREPGKITEPGNPETENTENSRDFQYFWYPLFYNFFGRYKIFRKQSKLKKYESDYFCRFFDSVRSFWDDKSNF